LADFSDAFRVEKMRSGNAAVYLLKEQFEKYASSPQKLDVCETIAHCFFQLEQYEDAGRWYETSGKLILTQHAGTPAMRAMNALGEYERALDCYRLDEDDDKFTECSEMVRQLKRACASS
jgi:tetratricopeptide (TPR) repeat protein